MISRKNRFHGHNSVSRVRGATNHSLNLSLRYAKNNKKDYRLAVVVSKKVDNRAVIRNRIRRRIFEAVRTQGRFTGIPTDLVIYGKSSALAIMPYEKLSLEVLELTKKALIATS